MCVLFSAKNLRSLTLSFLGFFTLGNFDLFFRILGSFSSIGILHIRKIELR